MFRTTLMSATLLFASSIHATCVPDAPEIGDTGPSSQLVCKMMESQFPQARISIIDREIHGANRVSVIADVDGQAQSLTYQLVGADWRLTEPALAKND
jgi:hypothetical protein